MYQFWQVMIWVFLGLGAALLIADAIFYKAGRVRQAHDALQGKGVEEEVRRLREQRAGTWTDESQSAQAASYTRPGAYDDEASNSEIDMRVVTGTPEIVSTVGTTGSASGFADDDDDAATTLRSRRGAGENPAAGDLAAGEDEAETRLRVAPQYDNVFDGGFGNDFNGADAEDDEGATQLWVGDGSSGEADDEAETRLKDSPRRSS